jgi:hypothetical protein
MKNTNTTEEMLKNSNLPQIRKEKLLIELKKNVPQIDWKYTEIKEEITHLNDGRTHEKYDIYFDGIHKESKDKCFIKFNNGRENVLRVGYNHFSDDGMYDGMYDGRNTNHEHIYNWDGVNEFFNEYCVGFEERERKIKSDEMETPNMKNMKTFGNYTMSKIEYSEGFLNLILKNCYSNFYEGSHKSHIKELFTEIENRYRELIKETHSKEEYEEHFKNTDGFFGTPSKMVESYLEESLVGELGYWLEDKWEEIVNN